MFDSFWQCLLVGLILCVYFYIQEKRKKKEDKSIDIQAEDQVRTNAFSKDIPSYAYVNKDRIYKYLECGAYCVLSLILSLVLSNKTDGEGLAFKIGMWFGHIMTIAVVVGIVLYVRHLFKKHTTYRNILNVSWMIGCVVYLLGFFAYGSLPEKAKTKEKEYLLVWHDNIERWGESLLINTWDSLIAQYPELPIYEIVPISKEGINGKGYYFYETETEIIRGEDLFKKLSEIDGNLYEMIKINGYHHIKFLMQDEVFLIPINEIDLFLIDFPGAVAVYTVDK